MGSNILMIFVKVVTRGSGLKVSAVVSINLLVILLFRNNALTPYLTMLLSMVASAAIIIIDFRLHSLLLYVLYVYGSRPNTVRILISLYSLLIASILSLPYLAIDLMSFSSALTSTFLIALSTLSLIYKNVRGGTSIAF
ncbi:MAG: hypothetical protein LM561_01835 [Desulfurococcaceae archaeon]|nr:hypothetical protein [Desulfurococcaceae archaeon]